MSKVLSGKWYAQAIFELALGKNDFESWQKDLQNIAASSQDGDLTGLLENPKVPFTVKMDLLRERLGDIDPLAFNLALLLVSKGAFGLAGDISRQFDLLLDAHRGIERAEVTTAVPLNDKERELISQRLGEIMGRKVVLDTQVDPSVIGGFVARVGDMLIDGSVRERLDTLKKTLVGEGRS
jgi:F-type H+-transporting ATPase subunit delta